MKMLKKFQFALKQRTNIFGGIIVMWGISSCLGSRPVKLGLKNNLFAPCPVSPNCVLSLQSDAKHRIPPLFYTGSLEVAKERLNQVILSLETACIITQNGDYWHVEFTSRWMSFVDDVEFYFMESEDLIHVRSASRMGYYDYEVNRKRVEKIRFRFEKLVNGS
jgi:uncharacterized protein (DUF1499 family)